jgi:hypothetical protein
MIQDIKTDLKRIRLLEILGQQLELLVHQGKPNLHSMLTSLKAEALVSEEECKELAITFALEEVSYSDVRKEAYRLTPIPSA